jgi:hypothetical protein
MRLRPLYAPIHAVTVFFFYINKQTTWTVADLQLHTVVHYSGVRVMQKIHQACEDQQFAQILIQVLNHNSWALVESV